MPKMFLDIKPLYIINVEKIHTLDTNTKSNIGIDIIDIWIGKASTNDYCHSLVPREWSDDVTSISTAVGFKVINLQLEICLAPR